MGDVRAASSELLWSVCICVCRNVEGLVHRDSRVEGTEGTEGTVPSSGKGPQTHFKQAVPAAKQLNKQVLFVTQRIFLFFIIKV